jgi:2-methylcitrate dehydratase PrpD
MHVRVGTNSNMPNALIHHRPKDELQAKFSMEFCMAILLLDGRAGLAEFTDEAVAREDVKAMIERIDFVIDEIAEAAGYHLMTTIIDIELSDGRKISGRADFGKGSPAFPMTYDEVAGKFRENVAFAGMPSDRADEIIELVSRVEDLPSLDRLSELLLAIA